MKKFNITVNGTAYDVEVNEVKGAAPAAAPKAAPAAAPKAAPAPAPAPAAAAAPVPAGAETVKAPMPGKILSVAVSAGQAVKKGETLFICFIIHNIHNIINRHLLNFFISRQPLSSSICNFDFSSCFARNNGSGFYILLLSSNSHLSKLINAFVVNINITLNMKSSFPTSLFHSEDTVVH